MIHPITVYGIRDNLELRFERLNEKQNKESENDNNQEVAFFGGQFKKNVKIMVQSVIKRRITN
jgi:hypothetical protein